MSSAEERRKRILANKEDRLAKIRGLNRGEQPGEISHPAPISSEAPEELLKLPQRQQEPSTIPASATNESEQSSLLSKIHSAINFMNSFTTSPSVTTKIIENTEETMLVDKQHVFVLILGILISILYSFYISGQSNLFFLVYFTCTTYILTSRYYMMQMKHRKNILITTAMLSGFKPDLMKNISLVYTLIGDAWVIFALYFVSFCLTHVLFSLF